MRLGYSYFRVAWSVEGSSRPYTLEGGEKPRAGAWRRQASESVLYPEGFPCRQWWSRSIRCCCSLVRRGYVPLCVTKLLVIFSQRPCVQNIARQIPDRRGIAPCLAWWASDPPPLASGTGRALRLWVRRGSRFAARARLPPSPACVSNVLFHPQKTTPLLLFFQPPPHRFNLRFDSLSLPPRHTLVLHSGALRLPRLLAAGRTYAFQLNPSAKMGKEKVRTEAPSLCVSRLPSFCP